MDLEELALSHLNPINALLHVLAAIVLVYALWMHEIVLIVLAIVLALLGHVYVALIGWKYERRIPIEEAAPPTAPPTPVAPVAPVAPKPKVRKRRGKGKGVKVKIE